MLTISAISLAGTAAYFSVFGLSKLFHGAGIGIIILATSLEFSKLVAVSYVYRYWKTITKLLRVYYIFGIVFIMLLTSIGVYGFLSASYQSSANKIELRDSQITISQNKRNLFTAQLDRINKSIESDNNRISKMTDIRDQQESRINNLYNNRYTSSARRTENQIGSTDNQINAINDAITSKMAQINAINDSISAYDQIIVELKTSDVSSEIGPLKYLADLTGYPMNKIVNILVLLIIFVFDPMAIALLIGVNQLTMLDKGGESDTIKLPKLITKRKKDDEEDEATIVEEEEKKEKKIADGKEKIEEKPFFHLFPIEKDTMNYDNKDGDEEDEEDEKNKIEKLIYIKTYDIKEGMMIYHDNFGKGKVLKSDIEKNRILINFEKGGIKEINPIFAKLKQVVYVDVVDKDDNKIEDIKKEENVVVAVDDEEDDKNSLETNIDDDIKDNNLNVKLVEKEVPLRDDIDLGDIKDDEKELIDEKSINVEEVENGKKKMKFLSTKLSNILALNRIGLFKKK